MFFVCDGEALASLSVCLLLPALAVLVGVGGTLPSLAVSVGIGRILAVLISGLRCGVAGAIGCSCPSSPSSGFECFSSPPASLSCAFSAGFVSALSPGASIFTITCWSVCCPVSGSESLRSELDSESLVAFPLMSTSDV